MRNDRAAIEGQTGAHILIGGTTGSNIDVSLQAGQRPADLPHRRGRPGVHPADVRILFG